MPSRKPPFLSLVLLCLAAVVSIAEPAAGQSRLDRKVDGGGVAYNAARTTQLPSGPAKLYLTLIVADNYAADPRQRQVANWFQADPRLLHVKSSTHWNWYTHSNPHFRDRLRNKVGDALPIVVLQRADGHVLMNVTAISMPHSAGEMADLIDDALAAEFEAPKFAGQTDETPIVEDCGPDGCSPNRLPDVQLPAVNPLPEVIPQSRAMRSVPAIFAALVVMVVLGGLAWLAIRGRPSNPSIF